MKNIIPAPETLAREVVKLLATAVIVALIVNHSPGLKKLLGDKPVGGVI